jgi:hypothetical protein
MTYDSQRCAYIQTVNYVVINITIGNPITDIPPDGFLIVGIPDDSPVTFGWIYDPVTGQFTAPVGA